MVDTSIKILAIFMHHFKINLIITESTGRIQEIKQYLTVLLKSGLRVLRVVLCPLK